MRNSRQDVIDALEAAGWIGDDRDPLGVLCHYHSGAVWASAALVNDAGNCHLIPKPGAGVILTFPGATPDAVVIAACLAAASQLNPDPEHMAELERRSDWLACLEAAGLDSWEGVDMARELRAERDAR